MSGATKFSKEEALDQIAGLRRASRLRLLMAIGLLAIIVGFAILTLTIERRREAAEAKAANQAVQITQTDQVLASAQQIVTRNAKAGPDATDWRELARLLKAARRQNDVVGETVDVDPAAANAEAANAVKASPQVVPATVATPAPVAKESPTPRPTIIRLYIQIATEDQRAAAQLVAAAWNGRELSGATVVVPGIELAKGADSTVRCTRPDACAMADQVVDWINASLVSPKFRKVDLSKRYSGATKILPGTFEVWFGPGEIVMTPAPR